MLYVRNQAQRSDTPCNIFRHPLLEEKKEKNKEIRENAVTSGHSILMQCPREAHWLINFFHSVRVSAFFLPKIYYNLLYAAPRSFMHLHAAPCSSTHLRAAPRTSTQLHAAPRSSTQVHAAPRTSSQLHAPPRSSMQLHALPRSSTQRTVNEWEGERKKGNQACVQDPNDRDDQLYWNTIPVVRILLVLVHFSKVRNTNAIAIQITNLW